MHCINCKSERISTATAKLTSGKLVNIKHCLDCGQVQHKIPLTNENGNTQLEEKIQKSLKLKADIRKSWEEDT